uniref:Uncharacterized protein n=1 Tax=Tetranychus urticae TaxID=32264 RepID=T1K3N4_TETUR
MLKLVSLNESLVHCACKYLAVNFHIKFVQSSFSG